MALECRQSVALEDALGLVGKQHRVAVERDAHFGRVRRLGPRAVRIDACGWQAGGDRKAHVGFVVDGNRFAFSGRR